MKRAGPNSTAAKERKRTDTTGIQASLAGRKQCWFADGGEQQRESVQESLWLEFDPICLSFKLIYLNKKINVSVPRNLP